MQGGAFHIVPLPWAMTVGARMERLTASFFCSLYLHHVSAVKANASARVSAIEFMQTPRCIIPSVFFSVSYLFFFFPLHIASCVLPLRASVVWCCSCLRARGRAFSRMGAALRHNSQEARDDASFVALAVSLREKGVVRISENVRLTWHCRFCAPLVRGLLLSSEAICSLFGVVTGKPYTSCLGSSTASQPIYSCDVFITPPTPPEFPLRYAHVSVGVCPCLGVVDVASSRVEVLHRLVRYRPSEWRWAKVTVVRLSVFPHVRGMSSPFRALMRHCRSHCLSTLSTRLRYCASVARLSATISITERT